MSITSDLLKLRKKPSSPLKTGQWYSNFSTVKKYAIDNGIPLMAVWTNGDACGKCITLESNFLKPAWKNWMKESGILFYLGCSSDTNKDDKMYGTAYTWCMNNKLTWFPFVRFYWYDAESKKTMKDNAVSGDTVDNHSSNNADYVIKYCKKQFSGYTPKPVKQIYSVTFTNFDGTMLKAEQKVTEGSSAVPPSNPIRDGYTFTGWKPSYTNIMSNTVCVAQYEENKIIDPTYPVSPSDKPEDIIPELEPVADQHKIRISNGISAIGFIQEQTEGENALQKNLRTVVLGEECARIQPSCFIDCENLESVILNEKCKYIGDYAFAGCKKLKYITCLSPNSYMMNYIGNHAFDGCESLENICLTLSSGYYNVGIGEYCFANCSNLKTMTQRNSAYLGAYMFYNCPSLTSIDIPTNTNYVFPYALAGIPNLKTVTIPNSIWFLNDYMFKDDVNLTSIVITDSDSQRSVLNMLGKGVFAGCSKLSSVTLPRSINALTCIDDGFLLSSSVSSVRFNGLDDTVFANKQEQTVDFGQYKTGVEYIYFSDAQAVKRLADKYNVPIVMLLTNIKYNDPNSPDYGYVLNKNGNYASTDFFCSHCDDWEKCVDATQTWKNFVKNSGYFFIKGGKGPYGSYRYDAKVKWGKNNSYTIKQIYRVFDAGRVIDFLQGINQKLIGTFEIAGCYWKKPDGSVVKKNWAMFEQYGVSKYYENRKNESVNVPPKIKAIKDVFNGYNGPTNFSAKYEINEKLTTFGLDRPCIFISNTGKSYTCSNTAYIEYQPEVRVDMYEKDDFEYGTWYYNAEELRKFADDNGIPVLIEYSSEGCDPCVYFKRYVYNNDKFQNWVKNSPYLFCRIETGKNQNFDDNVACPPAYYVKNVWTAESPHYRNQGIPVFMWYWKKLNEDEPHVWDISSYHFNPDWEESKPPFSMEELMSMTDQKFNGYTREDKFKHYDVSALYSTADVLVGKWYYNHVNIDDDLNGKHFQCTYKKIVPYVNKTINIKGYNGPFPTQLSVGMAVQFNPGTYQYYTSPADAQYMDESFCIFRVDDVSSKNVVSYLLSGYNDYSEDEPVETTYETGVVYNLSSESDIQTFNAIITEAEQVDLPVVVFCLDSSLSSIAAEMIIDSSEFKLGIGQKLAEVYFIKAKTLDWSSNFGKTVVDFVSQDRLKTTAYDEPGFPDWNASAVPIAYLYLGCASCVIFGSPASVEIASTVDKTQFTSASALSQIIQTKLKIK